MNADALSRRDFLQRSARGAASLALPFAWRCASDSAPKSPNILFLLTDDQRFNTIRAWENPEIETPNMDQLAQNGVSFSNAYIMGGNTGAICMPSRAMLLTGRTLWHLQGNGDPIPESFALFPELLRRCGYQTYGVGKWHNGPAAFHRCFEGGDHILFGGMGDHWNVRANHYDPSGAYDNIRPYINDPYASNRVSSGHVDVIRPGMHSSELFADTVIRFLRTRDWRRPFLAYTAFMAPHDPRSMPKEYLERYDPDKLTLPENFMPQHPFDNGEMRVRDELLEAFPRTPEKIRRHLAEYYAMITHLDAQIGRILTALLESGAVENTFIVFAGDNGLALGQHGLMGKQSVYDHSVHVPLIISGPGISRNQRREALCYLLDIYPTLCDLLGIAIPESVEGSSLRAVLSGEKTAHREAVYFSYRHLMRGVRVGDWKLIVYNLRGEKRIQLFNLKDDPWEMHNLAADARHASRVRDLTEQLRRLMQDADDPVDLDSAEWKS